MCCSPTPTALPSRNPQAQVPPTCQAVMNPLTTNTRRPWVWGHGPEVTGAAFSQKHFNLETNSKALELRLLKHSLYLFSMRHDHERAEDGRGELSPHLKEAEAAGGGGAEPVVSQGTNGASWGTAHTTASHDVGLFTCTSRPRELPWGPLMECRPGCAVSAARTPGKRGGGGRGDVGGAEWGGTLRALGRRLGRVPPWGLRRRKGGDAPKGTCGVWGVTGGWRWTPHWTHGGAKTPTPQWGLRCRRGPTRGHGRRSHVPPGTAGGGIDPAARPGRGWRGRGGADGSWRAETRGDWVRRLCAGHGCARGRGGLGRVRVRVWGGSGSMGGRAGCVGTQGRPTGAGPGVGRDWPPP